MGDCGQVVVVAAGDVGEAAAGVDQPAVEREREHGGFQPSSAPLAASKAARSPRWTPSAVVQLVLPNPP
jgi:hypothetical protein